VARTLEDGVFLKRVKALCVTLRFPNASAFKVHSFRHHFASLCANHRVAERKALAWLGHSDSDILKLYYHLSDAESAAAMESLATPEAQQATTAMTPVVEVKPEVVVSAAPETPDALGSPVEGESRAPGQSRIERFSKQQVEQALTILFGPEAERGGFEPPVRLPVHSISSAAPSATRTPLREGRAWAARLLGSAIMGAIRVIVKMRPSLLLGFPRPPALIWTGASPQSAFANCLPVGRLHRSTRSSHHVDVPLQRPAANWGRCGRVDRVDGRM
jgi:hypothetical protein